MASQLINDAQNDSRTVRTAGIENLDLMCDGMYERYQVPQTATRAVITGLVTTLKETEDRFVATDAALDHELTDDDPLRVEREAQVVVITDFGQRMKRSIAAAHGDAAVEEVGLDGRFPTTPQAVATLGAQLIKNLEQWTPRPSLDEDVQFKPEKWIARFEEPVAKLKVTLDALSSEERQAQQLRSDRDRDAVDFDDAHDAAANIIAAILDAIGRKDLGDRVRRTRHHARKTVSPEPEVSAVS